MAEQAKPTHETKEIREEICQRRTNGEKLPDICADEHMPHYNTVINNWWLGSPGDGHDQFRIEYLKAMQSYTQRIVDEIVDIADDKEDDWVWSSKKGCWYPNNDTPTRAKVRIDTRKWIAQRLLPMLYGDTVKVDVTSSDDPSGSGARTLTDEKLAKLSTPALREVLSVLRDEDPNPGVTVENEPSDQSTPAEGRETPRLRDNARSRATDAPRTEDEEPPDDAK